MCMFALLIVNCTIKAFKKAKEQNVIKAQSSTVVTVYADRNAFQAKYRSKTSHVHFIRPSTRSNIKTMTLYAMMRS